MLNVTNVKAIAKLETSWNQEGIDKVLLPKTKFLILALFIAFAITSVLYLLDVQFRIGGYFGATIVIMIAIAIYAIISRIAEKLKSTPKVRKH